MQIEDDKIIFNSDYENYRRESTGRKNNTVRHIFAIELTELLPQLWRLRKIKIIAPNGASFERVLTDVTYYGDKFIFSW
jgi:hypothetical protein